MAAAPTRRGLMAALLLLLVLTASAALVVGGETILRSGVVPHTPFSRCVCCVGRTGRCVVGPGR